MKFEIVEKFLRGKRGEDCGGEDGLVITENFVVVIDGMTSKTGRKIDGKPCGEMARDVCVRAVQSLEPQSSLNQTLVHFTKSVSAAYDAAETGLYEKAKNDPLERFGAVVGIFSAFHKQVWLVGDAQGYVDDLYFDNPKQADIGPANKRSAILKQAIAAGQLQEEDIAANDIGRAAILDDLKAVYKWQNHPTHPLAYAVVDGFEIPTALVKVIDIPPQTQCLVLASDGYPDLKPTLAESEDRLRWLMENDPYCYKHYLSTKGLAVEHESFDDRSYVRIRFVV